MRNKAVLAETGFDAQGQLKLDKEKKKRLLKADETETTMLPLFSDLSKGKLIWDLFIVTLAILTSFTAPIEFVFTHLEDSANYRAAMYLIDLIFIVDVGVNFRTTFISHDGQEVKDVRSIAKRYIRGMFIFDFLSSLPLNLAFKAKWTKYLKILKLVRIKKLNSVI